MTSKLAWVAVGGLGIGIAALSLAYALSGDELRRFAGRDYFFGASCRGDDSKAGDKPGTGRTERRWTWDGGDTVEVALPAHVHYRAGDGSEVIVRGLADAVANVRIKGSRISSDCVRMFGPGDLDITLPGRLFKVVSVSGSGTVVMDNLAQPALAVRISGSGSLSAQGTSDQVTVSIAGSGRAKLASLATKQLTVDISGSGKLEAAPQDVADVRISGSGNVHLLSRPASLRSQTSGSGGITTGP